MNTQTPGVLTQLQDALRKPDASLKLVDVWNGPYPRAVQVMSGRKNVVAEDIAHALSLTCRFGGHVTRFYSVAEHCVLLSHAVSPENALWALLHDAAEAYVGDMVRPLKRSMPEYQDAEDAVLLCVALRFGLLWNPHVPHRFPDEVKDADNRILRNERAALLTLTSDHWPTDDLEPLPVAVTGWDPWRAEHYYLDRLSELLEARAA